MEGAHCFLTPLVFAAIKTPYLPNGKFDLESYDAMVENQITNGVEGLIVGGTTGEGQLMSWDEHVMLIAHTGAATSCCVLMWPPAELVAGAGVLCPMPTITN